MPPLSRRRNVVISLLYGTNKNDFSRRLSHQITLLLPQPSISPSSLFTNVPVTAEPLLHRYCDRWNAFLCPQTTYAVHSNPPARSPLRDRHRPAFSSANRSQLLYLYLASVTRRDDFRRRNIDWDMFSKASNKCHDLQQYPATIPIASLHPSLLPPSPPFQHQDQPHSPHKSNSQNASLVSTSKR